MKRLLLIFCLGLAGTSLAFGQGLLALFFPQGELEQVDPADIRVFERWPDALGYYFNGQLGNGLFWQHWFGLFGVQLTAGGLFNPTGELSRFYDYHALAHFSWRLHQFEYRGFMAGNLYGLAMVGHRGYAEWIISPGIETSPDVWEYPATLGPHLNQLFIGLGAGVEYVSFEHLAASLEFMYVWSVLDTTIDLNIGTSLRFRF